MSSQQSRSQASARVPQKNTAPLVATQPRKPSKPKSKNRCATDENQHEPSRTPDDSTAPKPNPKRKTPPATADDDDEPPTKTRKTNQGASLISVASQGSQETLTWANGRPRRETRSTMDRFVRESSAIAENPPRPPKKTSQPEDTPINDFAPLPPKSRGRKGLQSNTTRPDDEAPLVLKPVLPKNYPKPRPLSEPTSALASTNSSASQASKEVRSGGSPKASTESAPKASRKRRRRIESDIEEEQERAPARKKHATASDAFLREDDHTTLNVPYNHPVDPYDPYNHYDPNSQHNAPTDGHHIDLIDDPNDHADNDDPKDDDDDEYVQGHHAPDVYEDDQEPTQNYTDLGSENNDEQEEEEEEGTSCIHLNVVVVQPPDSVPFLRKRMRMLLIMRPKPLHLQLPVLLHVVQLLKLPLHLVTANLGLTLNVVMLLDAFGRGLETIRLSLRAQWRIHAMSDPSKSHRSKNKGSRPPNADKLAHHRRLQQDAPTARDNGRGEKDIQEAGSDDEEEEEGEEEEEPSRKRKRRTKRGGSPTPTQQGFYSGEWSQVITLNSFKVQEHLLSSGFFSTKARIEREAPEWAAQSISEIEEYVELELSPAFYKEHKDDMNKMMWMEVSHYRGSAKNDCRAIIDQYYDISSGPSGYKSPGEIASKVKALLEKSRFLQRRTKVIKKDQNGNIVKDANGKIVTLERIDNMMAPALGKVMELMLWGGENKRGSRVGDTYAHQFKKYTTRHISAAAAVLRCCIEEKKTGYHQNVNLSADNFESFYNTVYDKLEKSRADNNEHWNKMNVEWMKWRNAAFQARGLEARQEGKFVTADVFDFE
ncbi:hypothetical protein B0H16DRAFT_1898800 [Mycena metata]|uniref:DUF6532 domain-containing protein n=1 Tax=Mycena metata TaxID=1033252 RepID=A0AAD7H8W4_9AGAR|nr:hypothetical protein B0H16DRAFT_1898800 [Mycena metata]